MEHRRAHLHPGGLRGTRRSGKRVGVCSDNDFWPASKLLLPHWIRAIGIRDAHLPGRRQLERQRTDLRSWGLRGADQSGERVGVYSDNDLWIDSNLHLQHRLQPLGLGHALLSGRRDMERRRADLPHRGLLCSVWHLVRHSQSDRYDVGLDRHVLMYNWVASVRHDNSHLRRRRLLERNVAQLHPGRLRHITEHHARLVVQLVLDDVQFDRDIHLRHWLFLLERRLVGHLPGRWHLEHPNSSLFTPDG